MCIPCRLCDQESCSALDACSCNYKHFCGCQRCGACHDACVCSTYSDDDAIERAELDAISEISGATMLYPESAISEYGAIENIERAETPATVVPDTASNVSQPTLSEAALPSLANDWDAPAHSEHSGYMPYYDSETEYTYPGSPRIYLEPPYNQNEGGILSPPYSPGGYDQAPAAPPPSEPGSDISYHYNPFAPLSEPESDSDSGIDSVYNLPVPPPPSVVEVTDGSDMSDSSSVVRV